ncbi:CPBP family intramembrane glutamic endopeptidase [Leucobacter chironomi]|uniref:CPBP family intramembrane glutamic endopeptidase n=1 Tax=Leucobacter chironomi TaxID=491918 RepID=UPI00040D7989|nr:CPBP family intramembrane glutamic endopeptidase [Leucobacter chironomi]
MTVPEQHPAPQAAAPQQWAWAAPAPVMQTVETEPLEYHRLLRGTANYRWWKPLLLLVLSGVYFGVFTVMLTVVFIPILMVGDPGYMNDLAAGTTEIIDTQRPLSVLMSMLSIIIMLPAVILAMLSLGMRPVGRIWSVAARVRWGLLLRLLGAAVLALIAMTVVGMGAEIGLQAIVDPSALSEPSAEATRDFDVSAAMVSLVLVLVLVPIQAATEEVVFRGLFMQVLGSWLRNPWFAILIPSVAFAAAHIYDFWGLAAVGLLGVVAAWLTWRTGGLEAAIAIHIVNNLVGFGFMVTGFGGETAQTAEGGSAGGLLGQIVGLGLFVWLTLKIFRRGGHGRSRIDLVRSPAPAGPVEPVTAAVPEQPSLAGDAQAASPAEAASPGPSAPAVPPAPSLPAKPETEEQQRG